MIPAVHSGQVKESGAHIDEGRRWQGVTLTILWMVAWELDSYHHSFEDPLRTLVDSRPPPLTVALNPGLQSLRSMLTLSPHPQSSPSVLTLSPHSPSFITPSFHPFSVTMTPDRQHEPTLMGIPHEILLKILGCLFEDNVAEIAPGGNMRHIDKWPTAVLSTCHLLRIEGTRAMRARLSACELFYENCHPPELEFVKGSVRGYVYIPQVHFLRKYGDCIRKICVWDHNDNRGVPAMHWFPNLETLELRGRWYNMSVIRSDGLVTNGKLNKARLLQMFRVRFYDEVQPDYDWDIDLSDFVKNTTKGVDRSFAIKVCFDLFLDDEGKRYGSWVSTYH